MLTEYKHKRSRGHFKILNGKFSGQNDRLCYMAEIPTNKGYNNIFIKTAEIT
jgi:hypothetical protein